MSYEKSKALYERSKRSLAGGVSSQIRIGEQPIPLFFERGKGSKLFDVDGNEYIDYQMANGPAFFGHSPDFLLEAVIREMQRFQVFSGQHDLEIEVSEMVQKAVPCAELVRYNSSGTEAVQSALRMARAHTGRNKFIKFEGHYHGWMDSVMYSTFHPPLDRIGEYDSPTPVAVSAGQATGSAEEVIVLPWNDLDVLTKAVEEHKDHLAAIITEAIACNVNSSLPRAGYLEGVRKLCDDNGIVLIFDEVITGFRIALGGAQEYLGVTPDMGVFAKAMAGGFPISMVAAKRDLMASLEDSTTVLAGTYNSNVMVMAAAQACISKLMEDDGAVYEHIYSVGTRLMDGLRTLSVTHEEDVLIQGLGPRARAGRKVSVLAGCFGCPGHAEPAAHALAAGIPDSPVRLSVRRRHRAGSMGCVGRRRPLRPRVRAVWRRRARLRIARCCGRCGQSTPRRSLDPLTTAAERARNLSYSATHDVSTGSM